MNLAAKSYHASQHAMDLMRQITVEAGALRRQAEALDRLIESRLAVAAADD